MNTIISDDQENLIRHELDKGENVEDMKKLCCAYRYKLVVLFSFGILTVMSARVDFNIAIVDMVNYTAVDNSTLYTSDECKEDGGHNFTKERDKGEFVWSSPTQGLLLGAFYYGYILTQMIGGYFAEVTGPKIVIFITVLSSSLVSIVTPFTAMNDPIAFFTCRFLLGLCQGPIYPANMVLWSRWSPTSEVSALYNIINTGSTLGYVVSMLTTGYLCNLSFLKGWPLPFYLFGIIGLVWSFLWLFFASSDPESSKNISAYERNYILKGRTFSCQNTNFKRPLKKMATSKAVWAVILYFLFDGLAYYILFSGVPIYMRQILLFDISENGYLNAIPYIGMAVTTFVGALVADFIRYKSYLSTKNTRKLFTLIGEGSSALFVLGIGYLPCSREGGILCYTLALSFGGFASSGAVVNLLDIAPKYAGTLMGVCNLVVNLGGFLSPLIVSGVTKDSPNRHDWQIVFYIATAFYCVATLIFLVLGEGEQQEWAKDKQAIKSAEEDLTINCDNSDTATLVNDSNGD